MDVQVKIMSPMTELWRAYATFCKLKRCMPVLKVNVDKITTAYKMPCTEFKSDNTGKPLAYTDSTKRVGIVVVPSAKSAGSTHILARISKINGADAKNYLAHVTNLYEGDCVILFTRNNIAERYEYTKIESLHQLELLLGVTVIQNIRCIEN